MSDIDKSLDRLLRSAARAPRETAPEASYLMEERIVRGWSLRWQGDVPAVLQLIRHAFFWASILMIIALALSRDPSPNPVGGDADLTASAWTIIAHE